MTAPDPDGLEADQEAPAGTYTIWRSPDDGWYYIMDGEECLGWAKTLGVARRRAAQLEKDNA